MLVSQFNLFKLSQALTTNREQCTSRTELTGSVTIRRSQRDDARALGQLAALDGRPLPAGAFLLAEVNEELVAAAPLSGAAEPLANPFKPTTDILELLMARARQLRKSDFLRGRQAETPLPAAEGAAQHALRRCPTS